MFAEVTIETAALRALVYAGTIAAAGACLFATTYPAVSRSVAAVLRWQILIGVLLVLCVEPFRLVLFQLAISGGDAELAFGPDMRWMAFQMPNGQAAVARVAGVLLIVAFGLRVPLLGLFGCGLAIGSYALEGHTAATAQSGWASMILLVHLAVAHWWLGALWPLAASLRALPTDDAATTIERFGQLAALVVPLLLVAGGILFAMLVSWRLQLSDPYQTLVALKVLVVAALLVRAAVNKFVLTPRLRTDPPRGANALRRSIALEVVLACFVLVLTGAITSTSPGDY